MKPVTPLCIGLAERNDLFDLLELYSYLHVSDPVLNAADVQDHWNAILSNPLLRYVVARTAQGVVSTCALTLIPNLTRGARPYGLIENVVTHPQWRCQGIATSVVRHALDLAWDANCYKVMLLTGSTKEETLRFYEGVGFRRGEKTGFIAKPPKSPVP